MLWVVYRHFAWELSELKMELSEDFVNLRLFVKKKVNVYKNRISWHPTLSLHNKSCSYEVDNSQTHFIMIYRTENIFNIINYRNISFSLELNYFPVLEWWLVIRQSKCFLHIYYPETYVTSIVLGQREPEHNFFFCRNRKFVQFDVDDVHLHKVLNLI